MPASCLQNTDLQRSPCATASRRKSLERLFRIVAAPDANWNCLTSHATSTPFLLPRRATTHSVLQRHWQYSWTQEQKKNISLKRRHERHASGKKKIKAPWKHERKCWNANAHTSVRIESLYAHARHPLSSPAATTCKSICGRGTDSELEQVFFVRAMWPSKWKWTWLTLSSLSYIFLDNYFIQLGQACFTALGFGIWISLLVFQCGICVGFLHVIQLPPSHPGPYFR